MAINLSKGQGIKLTKNEQVLKQITLGCGWKAKSKGFFSIGEDIDIDASVLAYKNGKKVGDCYYAKLSMIGENGLIAKSMGDNRVGGNGKQDDETIKINIDNIGTFADSLYLVLNIYNGISRGQSFDKVKDSYVKVYDDNMNVMAQYDLNENYTKMTGVVVGKIVKVNGVFEFVAIGEGSRVHGLSDLAEVCKQY